LAIKTIVKNDLDFTNINDAPVEQVLYFDKNRLFNEIYREYIYKTFHGIDEKAFYLFKYAYELDRRYTYERIEHYHDFDEYLPIVT
jgi:hypothetical protein